MKRVLAVCLLVLAGCPSPVVNRTQPQLEVTPSSLDFGLVPVGTTTRLQLVLRNVGTGTLGVTSSSFGGTDAAAFSLADFVPSTLAEGQSVTVRVAFAPTRAGAFSGRLSFVTDATASPEVLVSLVAAGQVQAVVDAGSDAGAEDAGLVDGGEDAGADAGVDAGVDASVDSGVDAGVDAGFDAGVDAGVDAGTDAGPGDAGFDAGTSCSVIPNGWSTPVQPWANNPVLMPTVSAASQGSDNVYAPDVQHVMGRYVMFYGGQGGDGHDRIFMAWSKDRVEWRKWPSDAAPQPVLDRGTSNHVNDPSLVIVASGQWNLYYTDAPTLENDRIWLARNTAGNTNSLTAFTKVQQVLDVGPTGAWDQDKVGRPSVLLENGVYKMWFDGQKSGVRHVGYATSTDGVNFTKHPMNPLVLNAGAVDVKKIGNVYVMVAEGQSGTAWYTSPDGICWAQQGLLVSTSGHPYDAFGQVTPFLEVENGALSAVWFGGASVVTWNKNRIAVAFPMNVTLPAGGGCTACVAVQGNSCSAACFSTGASTGTCASPGSTNPSSCCGCTSEGCDACKGAATDCNAKCVGIGKAGGWCSFPGSTNPAQCCGCLE